MQLVRLLSALAAAALIIQVCSVNPSKKRIRALMGEVGPDSKAAPGQQAKAAATAQKRQQQQQQPAPREEDKAGEELEELGQIWQEEESRAEANSAGSKLPHLIGTSKLQQAQQQEVSTHHLQRLQDTSLQEEDLLRDENRFERLLEDQQRSSDAGREDAAGSGLLLARQQQQQQLRGRGSEKKEEEHVKLDDSIVSTGSNAKEHVKLDDSTLSTGSNAKEHVKLDDSTLSTGSKAKENVKLDDGTLSTGSNAKEHVKLDDATLSTGSNTKEGDGDGEEGDGPSHATPRPLNLKEGCDHNPKPCDCAQVVGDVSAVLHATAKDKSMANFIEQSLRAFPPGVMRYCEDVKMKTRCSAYAFKYTLKKGGQRWYQCKDADAEGKEKELEQLEDETGVGSHYKDEKNLKNVHCVRATATKCSGNAR